jgi:hypothetical protein
MLLLPVFNDAAAMIVMQYEIPEETIKDVIDIANRKGIFL